jgi:hypothetical protein
MNKQPKGLPVPFRPFLADAIRIERLAEEENRPQSVMMRILLHEALLARQGVVAVEVIGKLSNKTTVEQLEEMQGGKE